MKNMILSFTLLTSVIGYAQIVTIPDANFKSALVNDLVVDINGDWIGDLVVDTNGDGEIQVSEAEDVIALVLVTKNIDSLEGIEAFTALESLHSRDNNLTTVDISQNQQLVLIDFLHNNLTEIDLSQNTDLVEVYLGNNMLSEIDISLNENLVKFECSHNQLNSLDVSANQQLEILQAQGCGLNSIDLLQNPALSVVRLGGNNLYEIDVTQNVNLERLSIGPSHISSLDLSQNTNLVFLYCAQSDFETLDLSAYTQLEELAVWGNNKLETLDLSQNTNLKWLTCYLMPELVELNVQNGNNLNFETFSAVNSPNLTCIQVDDPAFSNSSSDWAKDSSAIYSENCGFLGVSDVENQFDFEISPNPVGTTIHIESKYPLTAKARLIDYQGRLIEELEVSTSIDVSHLSAGIYFLQLFQNENITVKRFLKN